MAKSELLRFLVLLLGSFMLINISKADTTALMIFISEGLPKEAIENYKKEAEKFGGVLLLQGLVRGSFEATKEFLGKGGSLQIDEDAFDIYKIKVVPTIVLAKEEDGELIYDRIEGNMNIAAALNIFKSRGDLPDLADRYFQGDAKYLYAQNLDVVEQNDLQGDFLDEEAIMRQLKSIEKANRAPSREELLEFMDNFDEQKHEQSRSNNAQNKKDGIKSKKEVIEFMDSFDASKYQQESSGQDQKSTEELINYINEFEQRGGKNGK